MPGSDGRAGPVGGGTGGRLARKTGMIRTLLVSSLLLVAAPALAAPEPDKPITQRDPSAVDVIATPASDLNLKKDEIPPILLAALADPYELAGLRRCKDLATEVARLDAVLGDDIDIAQAPGRRTSPGKVAQQVIGGFIPFRGLIREISGANNQDRRLQLAIYGGSSRRSFLKGVGLQRGCAWPARPATPQMLAETAAKAAKP